tara:strand:+ start:8 stop:163 length:156 start_codon:yes stop_codon:yes gene_type:complete
MLKENQLSTPEKMPKLSLRKRASTYILKYYLRIKEKIFGKEEQDLDPFIYD